MMEKQAVLKVVSGSFEEGFALILQVGEVGALPTVELQGQLPAAPDLPTCYRQWQLAYRALRLPQRLGIRPDSVQHISWGQDCRDAVQQLCDRTAVWLNHPEFFPLYQKLLEQLNPNDSIQLVLQTQHDLLQRLPWHSWDFFDRYPLAELTLSPPAFERVTPMRPTRSRNVRVLAVFGDGTGLDLETDQALWTNQSGIEPEIVTAPTRQALNQHLWDPRGWDILFFAGHSNSFSGCEAASHNGTSSHGTGATGQIGLNAQEQLTIPQLKYALRKAVKRGLAIAIFNSCDGLGLAQDLAALQIPQVIVMREPVPDPVAHAFLKGFLDSFSRNTPLPLALREAREQLQGLESTFPCASWLPVLCQNLAQLPSTWSSLQRLEQQKVQHLSWTALASCGAVTVATLGLEMFGAFHGLELKTHDFFMRRRPVYEQPDDRIVIIKNTKEDILNMGPVESANRSISDETLLQLFQKLSNLNPRVIGFDVYHDHQSDVSLPELPQQMDQLSNLVVVCKHPAIDAEEPGISPPPGLTLHNRLGFSDLPEDLDSITRRWLAASDAPETDCPAYYSFAAVISARYLELLSSEQNLPEQHLPEQHLDDVLWHYDIPGRAETARFRFGSLLLSKLSASAGGYRLTTDETGGYMTRINYRHLPELDNITNHQVSVTDFLNGNFDPELFEDRIVLVGTIDRSFGGAADQRDIWKTPYTTSTRLGDQIPGVYLQAHIISQIISAVEDGRPLPWEWPEPIDKLWIVVWGALGGLLVGLFSRGCSHRVWLILMVTEVGLVLMCWGVLAASAGWVPYVPAAIALAGSIWVVHQSSKSLIQSEGGQQ